MQMRNSELHRNERQTARDNGDDDDDDAQSKQKPAPNQRVYVKTSSFGRTIVLIRVHHKQQHNILHTNDEAAPRDTYRGVTGIEEQPEQQQQQQTISTTTNARRRPTITITPNHAKTYQNGYQTKTNQHRVPETQLHGVSPKKR